LLSFKNDYGHANVPQNPSQEVQGKYPQLATFCRNQRSQYTDMQFEKLSSKAQARIQHLESIGFEFNLRQSIWDNKYQELVLFYQEHGHSNVPPKLNSDLYNWMSYQRLKYRSPERYKPLTHHQIELLEKLEFRWSPKDEVWWKNYSTLKSLKELHGSTKTSDSKLRRWKNSLRRACREYVLAVIIEGSTEGVHVSGLNPDRLSALQQMKFCWLPHESGPLIEDPPEDIFEGYQ
jgi:hypothetical protein